MNTQDILMAMETDEELEYHVTGGEHNESGLLPQEPDWYPCTIYGIAPNGNVEIGFTSPELDGIGVTVLAHNIPLAFRKSTDITKRERRRLFIQAMRHPEMRLLRKALKDLKWEHCVDWRDIQKLEVHPPLAIDGRMYGPWMLVANCYLSICYSYEATNPSFYVERLHDADDEFCECEWCQDSRLCYVRCKDVYTANT